MTKQTKINRKVPEGLVKSTVIAVDPDSNASAVAIYEKGEFSECQMLIGSITEQVEQLKALRLHHRRGACLVIEGQRIYKSTPRPDDILLLAQFTGALIGAFIASDTIVIPERIVVPFPSQWKGTVDKEKHHPRIYRALDWEYNEAKGYSYPVNLRGFKQSDWKHLADALGLGLWAIARSKKQSKQADAKARIKARKKNPW